MCPESSTQFEDGNRRLTLRILNELDPGGATERIGVRLWDGTRWPDDGVRPTTIVLRHPGALRSMLLPGTELALAEAYLYDDFDVEGNLESLFILADTIRQATSGWRRKLGVGRELLQLPADSQDRQTHRAPARLSGLQHSIERDRQAVTFHYDVSNDFYALWLDR